MGQLFHTLDGGSAAPASGSDSPIVSLACISFRGLATEARVRWAIDWRPESKRVDVTPRRVDALGEARMVHIEDEEDTGAGEDDAQWSSPFLAPMKAGAGKAELCEKIHATMMTFHHWRLKAKAKHPKCGMLGYSIF